MESRFSCFDFSSRYQSCQSITLFLFFGPTIVQEHYATSNEMNLAPTACCDLVGSRNAIVTDTAERMESTDMSGVARTGPPQQPMQGKGN